MNLSNVVTRIKLKLGLINIATPIENLDETIVNILEEITLPVFSLYNPQKESIRIKTQDLELEEKTAEYEKYILPQFQNKKLLYVIDVKYDTVLLAGVGSYGAIPIIQGNVIQQIGLSNVGANLMNMVIPKMTFKYVHPRRLYLYNVYAHTQIIIDMAFEHDKSLASIPETARESFMELAFLDIKENLYPTVKQYTELNTTLGNINLKLDEWANAESERKELIGRWDDLYHVDFFSIYYA